MTLLHRRCAPKWPWLELWSLVALAVLLGGCSRSPEAPPRTVTGPPNAVATLPEWGNLERVKITIERPVAFISATLERYPPQQDWFFGGTNIAAVQALLSAAGVTGPVADESHWLVTPDGIRVPVDSEFIFELSDQARQTLYPVLGQFPENKPQNDFSAFPSPELGEWFEDTGLSPQTIGWVTNRFYRQGGLVCFADLGVVLTRIDSPSERVRLVKTLSRETTMLLKLRVDETTDVDALVQYWGWPGRAKSLEPLLESLKRIPGGNAIDIVHLLPPFARQRLYTYPHARTNKTDGVQDCYWTAFNFFADTPEFRYGNTAEIKAAVEQDYQRVRDKPRMGDLMMLVNEQGMAVHAANFIADDVVFTKNGEANIRPWLLMDLEDLLAIYTTTVKPRVVLYRRKDFD